MKRFTLTLMVLLLMVGGVMAQSVTTLYLNGGNNITLSNQSYDGSSNVIAADVLFTSQGINQGNSGLTGTNWVASYNEGETHTFTVTLSEAPGSDNFSIYVGSPQWNFGHVGNGYEEHVVIPADKTTASISISKAYEKVYIFQTTGSNATLKISSITRTVSTPSSVAAPTITPASGTYDGDLSVTITKGDGNDRVVYSVFGATTGNEKDAEFTEASKTLTLTGTGTITVTAKGIKGTDESDVVTNTYTYGIPNGKTTGVSATYHTLEAFSSLKTDGNNPEPKAVAYFDFEDGIAIRGWGYNNEVPAPEITIEETTGVAIKGNKCMKVKNKSYQGDSWKAQFGFDFDNLERGCKYVLHLWGKASSSVSLPLATQDKPNNYAHRYDGTCSLTTEWTEKVFEFTTPTDNNVNQLMLSVGSINSDVEMYFDDFALYKVTEGSDAVAFTTDNQSVVIPSSAFSSASAGDYVALNVTGTPGTMAYKEHADNDEYKTPYLTDYTALTQTDGNWLIRVTDGMKTNGLTIKGHDMTLNSADIYKKVVISELVSNAIASKYDNVVVELTRSFAANKWNTVCLPYKPTPAQATLLFGTGYQIAGFTGVSGTTLEFTNLKSINDFVAGRPYLLMPGTGYATSTVVLENVKITAKKPETVTYTVGGKNYSFSGTFNTKSFAEGEWSTTRFVSNNSLMTPNSTYAMKGLRCYFTLPAADGARSFSLGFDEEDGTTSINTVQGSGLMVITTSTVSVWLSLLRACLL